MEDEGGVGVYTAQGKLGKSGDAGDKKRMEYCLIMIAR